MQKIRILSVGKTKEEWLNQAIQEYLKRLKGFLEIEFIWAKNDAQLLQLIEKENHVICLDAKGEAMTSEQFSSYLLKQLEEGGSRLTLVIGGPDGLPDTLRKGYPQISLSLLTFTHQLIRLMLVEQIYRAVEISKGSPYHK